MNKLTSLLIIIVSILSISAKLYSQGISINNNGNVVDNSAITDIQSNTQGILLPRMTSQQRDSIPSPAKGLLIFNITDDKFNFYKDTAWYELSGTYISATTGSINTGGGIAINEQSLPADSAAILDISSSVRGLLIPRTSTSLISAPATGLIIYDTTNNIFKYYDGTSWISLCESYITSITGSGTLPVVGTAINVNGNLSDPSAILDISSRTKGLLIPRMSTSQRDIIKAVNGLLIYNYTNKTIEYFCSTGWSKMEINPASPPTLYNPTNVLSTSFTLTWSASPGASTYFLDISDTSTFTTFIPGFNNLDIGNVTSYNVTGLAPYTIYYCRIRASNACGTSSSSNVVYQMLSCPLGDILIDSRDGKTYKTVQIGVHCWMAENLDHGITVGSGSPYFQQNNGIIEKSCYKDSVLNCTTYGGMYTFPEAVAWINGVGYGTSWSPKPVGNVQGVCPSGWHLPKESEWCYMENYVEPGLDPTCDSTSWTWRGTYAGGSLKDTGTIHWYFPNTGATNNTGFSALGGGRVTAYGSSEMKKELGQWWAAMECPLPGTSSGNGMTRRLNYDKASFQRTCAVKDYSFSVRCIKD